jgi:hypothetical protein
MRSQRQRAIVRVVGLCVLLAGLLLVHPAPAVACAGGDFASCHDYWLTTIHYPCVAANCTGLSGQAYSQCFLACWNAYRAAARADCTGCPI